jgi:hypothetical protein
MVMEVSVKGDVDAVLKDLGSLSLRVDIAIAQALNRTAARAKTQAVRTIAKESGIQQKAVRDRIAIRKASSYALHAIISAEPYAPNLIRYSARQTKRGVSANAWRKRRIYPRTFIANQGRTVFKRIGKARLPIRPVYGPSIPRTFMQRVTNEAMTQAVRERFPVEFTRALNLQLRRRGLMLISLE